MKYRYFTGIDLNEETLNKLGSEGWELISVVYNARRSVLVYYLKLIIKEKKNKYSQIFIAKKAMEALSDEQMDLEDEAYHAMVDDELSFNKR